MLRSGRALLKPDTVCTFGSLNTEVIFNNSLKNQGDLLVRLPVDQAWPGLFELTIEAWHIDKPRKIPQPRPPKPARRSEPEKSIFASLLETLSSTLSKTVESIEKQKLEDIEKEDKKFIQITRVTKNDTNESKTDREEETTEMPETSTRYIGGGRRQDEEYLEDSTEEVIEMDGDLEETKERKQVDEEEVEAEEEAEEEFADYSTEGSWVSLAPHGRLVLRLEREHVVYAGEGWRPGALATYHSSIDYSYKLACANNFTGPTCSVAKVCLGKEGQQGPRLSCTQEGEVVCQAGWQGAGCHAPICADGCHSGQGYCRKPGECRCKSGYSGAGCGDCVRLLGCVHGSCDKPFQCLCKEGWRGLFCSSPVCAPGCSPARGSCSRPGECRCRAGWAGESCGQCRVRDGCRHGSCQQPGECTCLPGWAGPLCDRPACGEGCHPEHGYCEEAGQCFCRVGYQGPMCDQCLPYPGCLNGECTEPWECRCRPGWKGLRCDQMEVEEYGEGARSGRCVPGDLRCMNGGTDTCTYWGNSTMLGVPRCTCAPSYSGEYCQATDLPPARLFPPTTQPSQMLTSQPSQMLTSQALTSQASQSTASAFPQKLDNSLEKLR